MRKRKKEIERDSEREREKERREREKGGGGGLGDRTAKLWTVWSFCDYQEEKERVKDRERETRN